MLLAAVPTFTRSMYVRKYMRQSRRRTRPGADGFRIFMGLVTSGLCVAHEIFHGSLYAAGADEGALELRGHSKRVVEVNQHGMPVRNYAVGQFSKTEPLTRTKAKPANPARYAPPHSRAAPARCPWDQ